MLAALALWTRMHEHLRERRRRPALKWDVDADWEMTTRRTAPLIARRLATPVDARSPLEHPRNWFTMWFCLELLNPRDSWAMQDPESWDEVRAELAYAMRETIRYDLFGDRVDYFHDASLLVHAVARLVEFHATSVVGIPAEYRVTGLMELIRLEGGAHRFPVIEHLQHVADIYIAGHFLLSLQVKRAGKIEPAEQLLAKGTADRDEIGKYRRAFSLAALFHDAGHLLLPSETPLPDTRLLETTVLELFRGRRGSARAHARTVTAMCIEQLGLGSPGDPPGHAPPYSLTYFNDERERQDFTSYLDRQVAEGRANHGLLGAWYLDRACVQAEGSWRKADSAMRECRRMAVRAILLHDIATAEIDADEDPIAALLVTCNEVFEWSPARQAIRSPSTLERPSRGAGASIPTARVDRSIEILGMGCRSDAAPQFGAEITVHDDHWPVVVVSLVPSEYLDVPVYRIWLAKAQEMGRIKPGKASGFAPALWIRSAPDPRFHHCGLSIRSGLKKALSQDRSRPEIVEWCSASKRFHPTNGYARVEINGEAPPAADAGPAASGDEVRLSYLPRRLCPGNIEDEMSEIIRIVDAYLESLENEQLRAGTE